jgi:hypothetical protein
VDILYFKRGKNEERRRSTKLNYSIFKEFRLPINIIENLICLISKQFDLPEPSVNVLGEELRPVAPVKVAKTSGGPDELHVGGLHDALEVVVLVAGLEADQVHAAFAAVVAGVEPVPFGAGQGWVVASPRQPVVVVAVTFNSCETKMKLKIN